MLILHGGWKLQEQGRKANGSKSENLADEVDMPKDIPLIEIRRWCDEDGRCIARTGWRDHID
jgi:hypothetical protein